MVSYYLSLAHGVRITEHYNSERGTGKAELKTKLIGIRFIETFRVPDSAFLSMVPSIFCPLCKIELLLAPRTIEAGTTGKNYSGDLAAAALTHFSATSIHFELTLEIAGFAAAVHIV